MLKPGDIVTQKNTMINKVNFNDNKENRLSIVLFSYLDKNNELYYCTVPITNATRGVHPKLISPNHVYMPSAILSTTKLCCAKIDSIYLYKDEIINSTGLSLEKNLLYRIYDKVLHLEVDEVQKELYNFIKIMINDIIAKEKNELKKAYKEKQKLKKLKRKELKRNYKK